MERGERSEVGMQRQKGALENDATIPFFASSGSHDTLTHFIALQIGLIQVSTQKIKLLGKIKL